MSNGFYKRRRGILEHIEAGEIDLLESGIHDYLSLKANLLVDSPALFPVGVCFTSAPAIHAQCKRVSKRTIQRCLEHLEKIGWLKTFKTRGKHGNYPVLLCRASVHDLSGNEYRINGVKTTDWRNPVYEPVCEVQPVRRQSVRKLAGLREERTEKQEEKKTSFAPSAQGVELASLLSQRIIENNHSAKITANQMAAWAKEADLMLKRDRRSESDIRSLIEWSQADPFWKTNILSMVTLRKQFDRLTVKRKAELEHGTTQRRTGKLAGADLTRANLKAAGFIQ